MLYWFAMSFLTHMDDSSLSTSRNPWSNDDRSLGSIRNVLLLAEKTGHLPSSYCQQQDHIQAHEDSASPSPKKCPSLRMIDHLRDIEKTQKAMHKATYEIQCRMQDKETKDVTHLTSLENRMSKVIKLNNHIQMVISKKDELIHRLQQPYVGDHIKIEATYKRYASEVIPMLIPILSELSTQLDNISWASNVNIFNPEMNSLLSDISSLLASLQSSFRSMTQMRQTVRQLHDQRLQKQPD